MIKLHTSATVLTDPVVEVSHVGVNRRYVRWASDGTPRGDSNLDVSSVTIRTNCWSATVSLTRTISKRKNNFFQTNYLSNLKVKSMLSRNSGMYITSYVIGFAGPVRSLNTINSIHVHVIFWERNSGCDIGINRTYLHCMSRILPERRHTRAHCFLCHLLHVDPHILQSCKLQHLLLVTRLDTEEFLQLGLIIEIQWFSLINSWQGYEKHLHS